MMFFTLHGGVAAVLLAPSRIFTASKIGWRALYTLLGSPLMLSAFARLLATVLSRTDCADMPEPATSKILNEGMDVLRYCCAGLLAGDRGHEAAEARVQE